MAERSEPLLSWFVPIDGDGSHIGTDVAERPPTLAMLQGVVEAAETAGCHSLLVPTRFANGLFASEQPLAETWTTAAMLAARSDRIRFLVAVRPGFVSAPLFAQMAATFAAHAGGRLDLNVVPGGIQGEFERFGLAIDHDTRYELATEFVAACRQLWASSGPVSFAGRHLRFDDVHCAPRPEPGAVRWYSGGASPAALQLAAEQADVLLAWIQPPAETEAGLERARAAFARTGRPARFGLRSHLVLGATEAEAWAACDELLAQASPAVVAQRQAVVAGTHNVGAAAQAFRVDDHRLGDRLWNGISTVRVNCGTAIVGTPDQVAEELAQYWAMGFDEFILSGWPHAESATEVATTVWPRFLERIG